MHFYKCLLVRGREIKPKRNRSSSGNKAEKRQSDSHKVMDTWMERKVQAPIVKEGQK